MQETVKAYIAGFLDGDGSIMLQIRPREDCKLGFRLYSTVCLYQDISQESELNWIADQIGLGYISKRNDGMLEYRIDGHDRVYQLLEMLQPYVHFKKKQTEIMLKALKNLVEKQTPRKFLNICKLADELAANNYKSRRKYSAKYVETVLIGKGFLPRND